MKDIILSLVFAAPLLVIMIYPSMKIADWLSNNFKISKKVDDKITVILTIILSLIGGLILHLT